MNELTKTFLNPKGKYGFWGIGLLMILGITLMVFPGWFFSKSNVIEPISQQVSQSSGGKSSLTQLENELAQEVKEILKGIEGAGDVKVQVTLEKGPMQEFAQNITEDGSMVEERDTNGGVRKTTQSNRRAEYVFAQGKAEPLLVREYAPEVKGVLIVAEGAGESAVKAKLIQAVQTVMKIPAHRVLVLPGESR